MKNNYMGVIIEKDDTDLTIPDSVPVFLGFDGSQKVGYATVVKGERGLEANMHLIDSIDVSNLYPAIGYRVTKQEYRPDGTRILHGGRLISVGLSRTPNVDETIKTIGEQGLGI